MSAAVALGAAALFSAGTQVYGGIQERKAANEQAALIEDQARLAQEEAETEARRKEEEREKFIAKQKVAFLANGIGLTGTGSVVLEDTFNQFSKEIGAIRKSGAAQAGFLMREASLKRKSGKAALISGLLGGGQSLATSYYTGKKANLF